MRFALLCILCGINLCFTPQALAASSGTNGQQAELDIRRDFEATLDLWRDGRYVKLYERTYGSGNRSREAFIRRISAAARRPACCWEKLQEVTVSTGPGKKATLQARIGLENRFGTTEYYTRTFRVIRDGGIWKPAMSDILSLAGKPGR